MPKQVQVRMYHERETKGTHRYDAVEEGNPAGITAIYLRKFGNPLFAGGFPAFITLTVEEAE